MNLSDAISLYLADRRAKGAAVGTLRHNQRDLQYLLADVGNIQTRSLRPQHVDLFCARRTTWGPGTMNRGRTTLSTFFKWCQARGYISRSMDLLEGHRKIRVPARDRVIIPQQEFSTFLEGITMPRSRAIMAIGLYLFTRRSETASLRWQNADLEGGTIDVFRPKTATMDTLPICEELGHELRIWRLAYAAAVGEQIQPGWYIIPGQAPRRRYSIPGHQGFCLSEDPRYFPTERSELAGIIPRVLKEAGYYQPQEGGHTLRRSGAIALYNQLSSIGHDRAIRVCQAMLGHASVSTTEIYLRLDLDRKVRNDLLAGKPMFPPVEEASVVSLNTGGRAMHGQANAGGV